MSRILKQGFIDALIAEKKSISRKQSETLKNPRVQRNRNLICEFALPGKIHTFKVTARKQVSGRQQNNFAVILSIVWYGKRYNLIRCDGFQGPHQNHLEISRNSGNQLIPKNTCHIHYITERYQLCPNTIQPEHYAERTESYSDFEGAAEFFCDHFGIVCQNGYKGHEGYQHRHPLFRQENPND